MSSYAIRTTNRRQNTYDESAPKQIFTRPRATNTCTPEASPGAAGLDPGQGGAGKKREKGVPTGA